VRRSASLAQLELPLAAAPSSPEPEPEPEPEPARVCAGCGWYCPPSRSCPVCHLPPQSAQ